MSFTATPAIAELELEVVPSNKAELLELRERLSGLDYSEQARIFRSFAAQMPAVEPVGVTKSTNGALESGSSTQSASASTSTEVVYTYDKLSRITRADYSSGNSITYDYDAAGNREQVIVFAPEPQAVVTLAAGSFLLFLLDAKRRRRDRPRPRDWRRRSLSRGLLLLVFVLSPLAWIEVAEAADNSGFWMVERPEVVLRVAGQQSPPSAPALISPEVLAMPAPLAVQSSASTEITPEIQELARALKYDVNLIFEYVYSQIEYTPSWGSNKGAMGALLDGVGGDFDQASLMVALLREADSVEGKGYAPSFVYGLVRINPTTLMNWLGVPDDARVLAQLLAASGRDLTRTEVNIPFMGATTIAYADVERVWVKVNIDGTPYVFDPALTINTVTPAIDLNGAMEYGGPVGFLTSVLAGATIGPDYVQNLNQANLENLLTGYTNNLVAYIRSNHPGATLDDIVGGRAIAPLAEIPNETIIPGQLTEYAEWATEIPAEYRTTLSIEHVGIVETFYADSLSGKRLTIFYDEFNRPVLRLDGGPISTGSQVPALSTQNLQLSAAHPYQMSASASESVSVVEGG